LNTVRQYAIGTLLTSTASQGGLAAQLSALIAVGLDVEWLRAHPRRLAAVTGEQVAAAAAEFFAPGAFTGVVVGDAEVIADKLTALGGVERADPAPNGSTLTSRSRDKQVGGVDRADPDKQVGGSR
jgi:hypothetical protein